MARQHPRRCWHAHDGSRRQAAVLLLGRLERSHLCTTSTTLLAQQAGWTHAAVKKRQQSPHGTNDGLQGPLPHESYGDRGINLF